jgi:NitT/TauT family transport system permease protein
MAGHVVVTRFGMFHLSELDADRVARDPDRVPTASDGIQDDPGGASGSPDRGATGGRGHRQGDILRLRGDVPKRVRWIGAGIGIAAILALWILASTVWSGEGFSVPTITATWNALVEMWREGVLWPDFVASSKRVLIGYSISLLIGASLGLLIGSFASVNSFFEPQIGFLRYIPATALVPLLIIWLGIDEAPKITLVIVGTVFYNILMVADVARAVPNELIKASYTLGARRWTVMRRVVFPHSWPGIVDVARINLAAAWLMLVVAELLAAQEGLAFRIIRAQRFRRIDRMFALLLVFGVLGIVSDMALRMLRNRTARWARDD